MLTQPQVQRYSNESGLRDIMIAEKEVVLTFLLQLLSERGILDRLAFKGGTCLRKMFVGSHGRFSTDLDFTGIEDHDHEDIILDMMEAFGQPFHGIQFAIPDDGYYATQNEMSWSVNPTYSHGWNASGVSEVKIQISRRETATLPTERRPQIEQSYFKLLPFALADIICLALPEIIAEKVRACYQRNKARDIYDLGMFVGRLDRLLIRRLVVLKLWQARDSFDPARLMQKFEDGRDFDWDDLRELVNRAAVIDRDKITADCRSGFGFLTDLTDDERVLANDKYQREQAVAERLRGEVRD
jgi:predicted nucleotidyltransferase component of viral defense system